MDVFFYKKQFLTVKSFFIKEGQEEKSLLKMSG